MSYQAVARTPIGARRTLAGEPQSGGRLVLTRRRSAMDLLKPNELARQLAVSRAWVYEAARSGRIPSVRIGGEDGPLRFVPEDIDRWLAEARAESPPVTGTAGDRATRVRARRAGSKRPTGSASEVPRQQSLL